MRGVYNNNIYDNPWKEEFDFCWYAGMRHPHAWLIYQSILRYWYKYENNCKNHSIDEKKKEYKSGKSEC